ncbi:MAG: chorismate synthase [Acidobacteriota bacterium]|nr:chorismate synthase [Acidobacteriota bacterium]
MRRLRLTTAGESHGPGLTAVLTGVPAGLEIDFDFVARDLARRQHGHGRGHRMKIERDEVEFRGGLRGGESLGSPIAMWIENRDHKNWNQVMSPVVNNPDQSEKRRLHSPRPGHADLAGGLKYLRRDLRDVLERASARESAARVAAGAIAKILLRRFGIEIKSGVRSLGPVGAGRPTPTWAEIDQVDDRSPLRAVDRELEPEMVALVDRMKAEGDTLGGSVTVIAHNVPAGLGSHVQWDDKLDGRLCRAVMSVPAVKAVEIGSALTVSNGSGSEAHDGIEAGKRGDDGSWARTTNRAGGLEGGVTNGQDVVITAYKKPISTLLKGLPSVDLDTLKAHRSQYERSDVTALPAAGVIAESMVALILADALLEKIGGDSMTELEAHFQATQALQRTWPSR